MQLDEILAKGRAATGLSDLGDVAMLEGLEILVRTSNEEANLSPAGASRWEANLVSILSNRLRIVEYLKQHPELLKRPIHKPMFVFGLPRTGTTLTINLLNADPARCIRMRAAWQNNSGWPCRSNMHPRSPPHITRTPTVRPSASIRWRCPFARKYSSRA